MGERRGEEVWEEYENKERVQKYGFVKDNILRYVGMGNKWIITNVTFMMGSIAKKQA